MRKKGHILAVIDEPLYEFTDPEDKEPIFTLECLEDLRVDVRVRVLLLAR